MLIIFPSFLFSTFDFSFGKKKGQKKMELSLLKSEVLLKDAADCLF